MQVSVTHKEDNDLFSLVANVTIPEDIITSVGALEYAYRWTNNAFGSWSKEVPANMVETEENLDWNENVEVLIDMSTAVYGLRSSSIGDIFLLDGQPWVVATMGFEQISN